MPRSLDPNARLTMVLACDVDKNPQPKIFARPLTGAQEMQLVKLMEQPDTSSSAVMQRTLEAAAICIRGWENMIDPDTGETIEYLPENIPRVLCTEEQAEVIGWLMGGAKATADDKKKSE